jgi:molybdopterin molybdotransferase
VLATGDEVRSANQSLAPNQIYDANRPLLRQLLLQDGAKVLLHPILPDQGEALERALLAAVQHSDLIVCTGGASAGSADMLPGLLRKLGRVHFWRMRVKPGMPALYAEIDAVPIIALPGNPVSVLVSYLLLVRRALAHLQARTPQQPIGFSLPLAQDFDKSHARREFARAQLRPLDSGWAVVPMRAQGSHLLSGASGGAELGLIDLPEGERRYACGESVRFIPLRGWIQ